MRSRQLSDLRQASGWLADVPAFSTTTWITVADANAQINAGVAEVMNLVIAAVGDTAYRKSWTITTATSTSVYSVPADFYELKLVEALINGYDWVPLESFTNAEEGYLRSMSPGWSGQPFKYKVQGKTAQDGSDPGSIEFLPVPASQVTIKCTYVFGPQFLVNDTDSFDGFAGFEDFAINYAARRYALREENYELADRLAAEMDRIRQNILGMMKQRDAFHPPRVQMTRDAWRGRWGRRRAW